MAVNLSAIKDLLLPGLRGIEGKYEMIPSQYDKDRKSTRLNSSHVKRSRMPSSA